MKIYFDDYYSRKGDDEKALIIFYEKTIPLNLNNSVIKKEN